MADDAVVLHMLQRRQVVARDQNVPQHVLDPVAAGLVHRHDMAVERAAAQQRGVEPAPVERVQPESEIGL